MNAQPQHAYTDPADDLFYAIAAKNGYAVGRCSHAPKTAGELHGWLLFYKTHEEWSLEIVRLGFVVDNESRKQQRKRWSDDVARCEAALEKLRSLPGHHPDHEYGYEFICQMIKDAATNA